MRSWQFPELQVVEGPAAEARRRVVVALQRSAPPGSPVDPSMLRAVRQVGVGWHHAGLPVEQRGVLEEAFRKGALRVLIATSTLAAGVNLPAQRVVIQSPHVGMDAIDSRRLKQMAGRAGRPGLDEVGEAFVICAPGHVSRAEWQRLVEPTDNAEAAAMAGLSVGAPPRSGFAEVGLARMAATMRLARGEASLSRLLPMQYRPWATDKERGAALQTLARLTAWDRRMRKQARRQAGASQTAALTGHAMDVPAGAGDDPRSWLTPQVSTLRMLLLEAIAAGYCRTPSQLLALTQCTLAATQGAGLRQSADSLHPLIAAATEEAVEFLVRKGFVQLWTAQHERLAGAGTPGSGAANTAAGPAVAGPAVSVDVGARPNTTSFIYRPSQLGLATFASGLRPEEAWVLLRQLSRARTHGMCLDCELHPLCILAPVFFPPPMPGWDIVRKELRQQAADAAVMRVLGAVGIPDARSFEFAFCKEAASQQPLPRDALLPKQGVIYRRVWAALILRDVCEDRPPHAITSTWKIQPGQLQQLLQTTAQFLSMALNFCKELRWNGIRSILAQYQDRLSLSVPPELRPLLAALPALKPSHARKIVSHTHLTTLQEIADCDPQDLERALRTLVPIGRQGDAGHLARVRRLAWEVHQAAVRQTAAAGAAGRVASAASPASSMRGV